jgi:hypothetical protein
LLFLGAVVLLFLRRKEVFTWAPTPRGLLLWCLAIPLGGLGAFCFGMGMVEVLCLKVIFVGSFTKMGFAPLSVFCGLVVVALLRSSGTEPNFEARRVGDA